uniref:Thioredoxin domain-containing protein n=1 Tax=Haptolina brevifila TaxID=156173 RepID=A0A7S2INU0_9EUKA|mmetsp:Transcript_69090/g.137013  ORF Transcript_69090/g.137013 Transcript_69090/m.137013 type:complete len:230 (+) Transcript_69090:35-724(+)
MWHYLFPALIMLQPCDALHIASNIVPRDGTMRSTRCMATADLCYDEGTGASTGVFTYVTDSSFDELVIKQSSTNPVLLALGATWCGPCKVIEPHLRRLNSQGDVVVVKTMLSDKSKPLREIIKYLDDHGHKISALPLCVLFYDGEPIDALLGRFSAKQLACFLEKQPVLGTLVRKWKSQQPPAPDSLATAEPLAEIAESGFERIEHLDPRIQARIRAAAEASTCSRKFG